MTAEQPFHHFVGRPGGLPVLLEGPHPVLENSARLGVERLFGLGGWMALDWLRLAHGIRLRFSG